MSEFTGRPRELRTRHNMKPRIGHFLEQRNQLSAKALTQWSRDFGVPLFNHAIGAATTGCGPS
jgi:hypothetical protein